MSRKNKYYMRGVGVGILVCALILIISRKNTAAVISDEEIISRARALGMIESGEQSLTEATGVSDASDYTGVSSSPEQTVSPSVQEPVSDGEEDPASSTDTSPETSPEASPEPSNEPSSEPSPEPSNEPSPEPSEAPSPEPSPEAGSDPLLTDLVYVTLTIYSGNSSDTVARRAEELGLVTNAKEFDSYLVTNGYANRIRVGSFEIPKGASYEFIAKAIT